MNFFTSDPHFYHTNVIKYCDRPYLSVEEMNEALVNNWNSAVKSEDTVYCLGDFSMAARPVETFTPRLNGNKFLIPGNHDWCHPYHKKSRKPENQKKWIDFYTKAGWTVLPEQITFDLEGVAIVNVCHLPYSGDSGYEETAPEYKDKYSRFRPFDDGRVLLHGHVHEKFLMKKSAKGSLMINVGVDVWNYKPVSEVELAKLILANK